MPITISHSPVGLLGTLAAGAGKAERQKADAALDLQYTQMGLQAQAQANALQAQANERAKDRAFTLQKAWADRELTDRMRTPAADSIAQRAKIAREEKMTEQTAVRGQLDKLLESGTIDDAQYQKGVMALISGNRPLMGGVLAAPKDPKPNIPYAKEADIIQRSTREQIKPLFAELASPLTLDDRKVQIQNYIAKLYDDQRDALDALRRQSTAPAKAPVTGTPGTLQWSTSKGSDSRDAVLAAEKHALEDKWKPAQTQPAQTQPASAPAQAPIRVRSEQEYFSLPVGAVYTAPWLPDGKPRRKAN